jgi:leader peptidase (prepilin peptidase)/N-methyltransferase
MWTQLPLLGILLLMAALTVVISVIDIKHQIIPDELQLVLLGLAFVHIFLLGTSLLQVALSLLVPLPILLIYLVTRGRGMGFGDVKLEVGLGLWLGLGRGLLGIYGGFLIGAVYGVILMLLKKAKGKTHIAFGPFLLLGAWIAYFLSTGWYAYCLSFLGIR